MIMKETSEMNKVLKSLVNTTSVYGRFVNQPQPVNIFNFWSDHWHSFLDFCFILSSGVLPEKGT